MLRAAKFRLYPTPEQEKFLWGQWGAVRFVWNKALWLKKRFWKKKGESLSVIMDLKPLLAVAKKSKKYVWLKQYDSMALQESLRHLDGAYKRFFKHEAGFPKWKSRRRELSSYHCSSVSVGDDWVRVPKIGRIKAVVHRKVEGKVKSITLSADTTGAYYAAVHYDDGLEEVKPIVDVYEDQVTGIDFGLKDIAIESNGTKEPNPRHQKEAEKHLRRVSKKFSRTKKGSRRHEKARKRLAKAHKRVANARNDQLHKISKRLIDENQAVCAESLKIKNMQKNRHLAKAIADAGWGTLCRMLAYKAKRAGKRFVQIDTFYASSKTCSVCGHKLDELSLSVREWVCPHCHAGHDRDVNAARNIRVEGIRKMKAEGQSVLKRTATYA